jgi:glycosyltransferase involved in cell wall biosynthesis
MKIAHSAVITPHQAGIYETTRDLVAGLRAAGVDSRITDPLNEPELQEDRGVPIVSGDWVKEADVICSHSGLSKLANSLDTPVVHFLHGRPHSSFLLEQKGKLAVYSYLKTIRDRFALFITFWPEFLDYWRAVLPHERVKAIAPPVDLDRWTPDGPDGYGFHGEKGKRNVVCASMWREDETPFHIINAFRVLATRVQGVKLHVYAAPGGQAWEVLRDSLTEIASLGEVQGMVRGLEHVYRAADCVITPHRIATRSVREPLACGTNVVMAPGNNYSPFQADPQDLGAYANQIERALGESAPNRRVAEMLFDPATSAGQLIPYLEQVESGFWKR